MAANVESMFSVREKPWHGLGTIVKEAPTSSDAIRLAGLDWMVVQEPIYTNFNKMVDGYRANVRSSDRKVLDKTVQGDQHQEFSDQEPARTGVQKEPVAQNGRKRSGLKGGGISSQQEIILMAELNRTGVDLDEVLARYQIMDISQMTPEIYSRAISALKQTKPKNRSTGTAA